MSDSAVQPSVTQSWVCECCETASEFEARHRPDPAKWFAWIHYTQGHHYWIWTDSPGGPVVKIRCNCGERMERDEGVG